MLENGISNGDDLENDAPQHFTQSSSRRIIRKSQMQFKDEDGYEAPEDTDAHRSSDDELDADDLKTNSFCRQMKQINYAIPPPIEEMAHLPKAVSRPNKGKARGPGWSANGTELS